MAHLQAIGSIVPILGLICQIHQSPIHILSATRLTYVWEFVAPEVLFDIALNIVNCLERIANNGTRHISIYYRRKKGTFDLQLDEHGQVIEDGTAAAR